MVAGVFAKSASKSMSHSPSAAVSSAARRTRGETAQETIVGARMVNSSLRLRPRPLCPGGLTARRAFTVAVLREGARDEVVDRQHPGHTRRGMPCAPDIAPARGALVARADVDVLADVDG